MCCPTDEHSRKPRSSQLSSPSEALWYTSPILPVQSQLWHLPCSVSFEKCSGCCRIQPGPFASSCAKENVEVVVCCRKEMSVLWYKPTSVPARPFQGHVQVVLSLVQGRLCGFSLPVQGQWDSLGFTACGCEATASAADLGRDRVCQSQGSLPAHHPAPGLSQGLAPLRMLQDTHGRSGGQWGPGPAAGAGHQRPVGSRSGDCRDLERGEDSAPGTTLPQQLWGMECGVGKGEKQGRSSAERCRM